MYIHAIMKCKNEVVYQSIFYCGDTAEAIRKSTALAKLLSGDHKAQVVVDLIDLQTRSLSPSLCAQRMTWWVEYDKNTRCLY